MKVINKEVKECEFENGTKNTVLDLEYTHRWTKWRILVKDYVDDEKLYTYILKQLRVQVRNAFNAKKLKWEA